MTGLVVRALIVALGLGLAGFMLIDWNALFFAGGPQYTNDARLQGDPTIMEAQVPGLVTAEAVGDDQPVRRGQLLFQIETDTYDAAIEAARAARDEAVAQLHLLQAQRGVQRSTVESARKAVDGERANYAFAREDAARWNALAGTPGDLLRSRQNANADEQRERATVDADIHEVAMQKTSLGAIDAQLESAEQQVAGSEAALALARIDRRWTEIRAPEDGVVTERAVHVGQYVTAGTPLIRFVPLPRVWAVSWYREEQVHLMRVGQHATVHVDAYPGLSLHGCVQSVAPVSQAYNETLPPDQATGNFTKVVQRIPVKITFPTEWPADRQVLARFLVVGLNVETSVETGRPADCTANPGR